MTEKHEHFVSVIIPVFNDAERLEICLRALQDQTYPKEMYEVVVVDNNSSENIRTVVDQFDQSRYSFEQRPGSYAARNKGIAIARGSILGFTDSDCIPAPDWIEQGVNHLLKNPDSGLVAGKIELFTQNPAQPSIVEIYDSLTFLRQDHYIEDMHFGATANLFTFKSVFEAVGLFNAELKSGGDREWGERVYAAGYPQIYAAEASVAHPARSRLSEIYKKAARVTEGRYNLTNKGKRPFITFMQDLMWGIRPPINDVRRAFAMSELKSISQKLALCWIFVSLRYLGTWKETQLYLKDYFQTRNA